MKEITQKIQVKLFELKDKKYKEFHGTLCNTCKYEIIGVRVPNLRMLAKDIIKEDFKAFLEDEEITYYEEDQNFYTVVYEDGTKAAHTNKLYVKTMTEKLDRLLEELK